MIDTFAILKSTTFAINKMTYRKDYNQHSLWHDQCSRNKELIDRLALPDWVFQAERNFRDFATTGALDGSRSEIFDFNSLAAADYWELFDFIDGYFEMDMVLFEAFKRVQVNRG